VRPPGGTDPPERRRRSLGRSAAIEVKMNNDNTRRSTPQRLIRAASALEAPIDLSEIRFRCTLERFHRLPPIPPPRLIVVNLGRIL
jgi:hypothetical protein